MDEGPTHDPKAYRHSTMDNAALGGCIVFSLAAVAQWACSFVPFAAASSLVTTGDLRRIVLACAVSAAICGLAAAGLFGLAGLVGTFAGLVPAGAFVHLRLRHALMGVPGIEGMQPAEFPASSVWTSPLLIAASAAALALAAYLARVKR